MVRFASAATIAALAYSATNDGVRAQQIVLRGGYVQQEFQSCDSMTCSPNTYCCKFTNSYRLAETSFYCMNDF